MRRESNKSEQLQYKRSDCHLKHTQHLRLTKPSVFIILVTRYRLKLVKRLAKLPKRHRPLQVFCRSPFNEYTIKIVGKP